MNHSAQAPHSLSDRNLIWWKKILMLGLQVVAFLILTAIVVFILSFALSGLGVFEQLSETQSMLVDWSIILLSSLGVTYLLDRLLSHTDWDGLGFNNRGATRALAIGSALGAGLIVLCFVILYLGGWIDIIGTQWQGRLFFTWLLFFLVQPLAEEVVMRSFLQNQIDRYFGPWVGLLGSALVFAYLHIGNDNFSGLAGLNIFLGGLLMGQLYLRYQNIWAPFALHAAWNFTQSIVLGFSVSGTDTYRWLQIWVGGPDWWTGGRFGLEGSVLSVGLLAAAVLWFWRWQPPDAPMTVARGKEALLEENTLEEGL